MKKMCFALIASMVFLPALSMAQANPQPPAAWVTFQQQENAKRVAFYQQQKADRDDFLKANPQVQSYLDELKTAQKTRMAAWIASHPRKTNNIPTP